MEQKYCRNPDFSHGICVKMKLNSCKIRSLRLMTQSFGNNPSYEMENFTLMCGAKGKWSCAKLFLTVKQFTFWIQDLSKRLEAIAENIWPFFPICAPNSAPIDSFTKHEAACWAILCQPFTWDQCQLIVIRICCLYITVLKRLILMASTVPQTFVYRLKVCLWTAAKKRETQF